MDHALVCQTCEEQFPPGGYPRGCPSCHDRGAVGRLQITFDLEAISADELSFLDEQIETNMWRYRQLLPLLGDKPVTLGEGWTPLLKHQSLSGDIGAEVLVKNETVNPTWSYKDRLNSVLISNIVTLQENPRIAVASTGNHGASTAAYARRGGIEDIIVLLPHESELPARAQIRSYGAATAITDFEERRKILRALIDRGWYPTSNMDSNYHVGLPYGVEGYKTIAFELVDQLETVPDVILVPVGDGDGLYGIWKGFSELQTIGVISELPRMIGVQAIERQPLVKAVRKDSSRVGEDPGPLPSSLSIGLISSGSHALEAIQESGGYAYAVEKEEVNVAIRKFGREGLFLEPSSAIVGPAVRQASAEGRINSGETVICIATGCGIKWPNHVGEALGETPVIKPTVEALEEVIPFPLEEV